MLSLKAQEYKPSRSFRNHMLMEPPTDTIQIVEEDESFIPEDVNFDRHHFKVE
jgi:hypothetical protein